MNHTLMLALTTAGISLIFLGLWLFGRPGLRDFGLNGFTETLGIGITVFLIERFQSMREEKRILPQRFSAYEDVRLLTIHIINFWHEAFVSAVPENSPTTVGELMQPGTIRKIGNLLDMDSIPNVTPKRTWWNHLYISSSDFKRRSETILERHNHILDPKAYGAVHNLINSSLDPGMIQTIRQADQETGFPRPTLLGSFPTFLDQYFETVPVLVAWCQQEAAKLKKLGITELYEIDSNLPTTTHTKPLSCMIPPEKLNAQCAAVAAFRTTQDKTSNTPSTPIT